MHQSEVAEQGGAAWLAERAGHATASCFADILAVGVKGQPLKAREDYLMKLVVERITGEPADSVKNFAMQWGTEAEPFARTEYEMQTGNFVDQVGFVRHPTIKWVGASADGLISTDGGIEIKCPYNSAIHLGTWRNGMPVAHTAQVQGVMLVLERDWIDFVSFDPRMQGDAAHLKFYVERIYRDDKYIAELEIKLVTFLAEVQAEIDSLLSLKAS